MYQSIFYNRKTQTIYLRDDVEGFKEIKYKPQVYRRVPNNQPGALPVLTGGYALPVGKNEKWDYKDLNILEKDISPELAVLRDLYYNNDESIPSYQNITFLDIEIEIGGKLTVEYIRSAPKPITSIALRDKTLKKDICFILDTSKEIEDIVSNDKEIISCSSEEELLYKFLLKFRELDTTILITWNGAYFDLPYLWFRGCKVIGEDMMYKISPIGQVNVQTYNPEETIIQIGGINHLDYLLLFKKYITKEEPSYKLGAIGEKYIDLGKIEYEGNLNTLFKNDINTFIEYNIRDVEIIDKLDDKMKFIELTILICHDCLVPYESITLTTVLNEGKILKYLKKKQIISNNKPTTDLPELKNQPKTDYAGGFLLEPNINLHKWGSDFDASSHYPTILMSLNIGAETLIGWIENNDKYNCWLSFQELKEKNPNDKVTLYNKLGKSNTITYGNLVNFINDNNIIVAANGALFDSSVKSILSEVLEDGFNKRQEYKRIMKEAGRNNDWEKYQLYNLKSTSIKYFINGCYGALSLPSFRYSDGRLILSKACTLTGQRITKEVIREMNSYLEEDLKSL